jgi:sugar/nucleoside kinase (ribokinase family)
MDIFPDEKPPFERTGAGDAFSSTFTAALALDIPPLEAIRWAPINSMNVVQYIGAQKGLLNRNELIKLLGRAPLNYQPVKI